MSDVGKENDKKKGHFAVRIAPSHPLFIIIIIITIIIIIIIITIIIITIELLRSVHACVRGSRTPFRSKIEQSLDCKINVASADI